MRKKGKISYWNDDKGYGFIQPNSGAERIFVHVRAFADRKKQPILDERVSYSLSTDKQGRPCAIKVLRAGEELPRKVNNSHSGHVLIALVFLSVVGMSVFIAGMPILILYIYLAASFITFLVYAIDKSAAKSGAWRKQETTLHALALVGGWPGAMIAQQTLRHKSSKRSFRNVFWLTVVLNCGFYIWLFTPTGEAALGAYIDEFGRMVSGLDVG